MLAYLKAVFARIKPADLKEQQLYEARMQLAKYQIALEDSAYGVEKFKARVARLERELGHAETVQA